MKKKETLEEFVLNALIKIREDKTRRRELKAKVSKIENELENKTLNSQKKQDLHKELKGQKAKSFIWKAATFVGVITTSYLLITK